MNQRPDATDEKGEGLAEAHEGQRVDGYKD